jgi:hypothetical protein
MQTRHTGLTVVSFLICDFELQNSYTLKHYISTGRIICNSLQCSVQSETGQSAECGSAMDSRQYSHETCGHWTGNKQSSIKCSLLKYTSLFPEKRLKGEIELWQNAIMF